MYQRITLFLVGIVGLIAGCVWVVSPQGFTSPVAAYSSTMPENPHIIYVAPEGKSYGQLTEENLIENHVTIMRDWSSVKSRASEQPLDALMTDADATWLQSQLYEGVVITGLGVDLDQFAKVLDLDTLRTPGEADVPLGLDEAYMVYALIKGQPEDVAFMRANGWLMRSLKGEETNFPEIKAPFVTSSGTSRSQLSSKEGVDQFFKSLFANIEGIYQTRSEYNQ